MAANRVSTKSKNWIARPPVPEAVRGALGGKASVLDALGARFPIPPWFAVLPPAARASLGKERFAALASARSSRRAAELLKECKIPRAFIAELREALRQICPQGQRVAVRSSAADEDGTAQSYAGQLESFVFVPLDLVPERIVDVWRSAFAKRVWAYRREHGLKGAPGFPTVLVQRMVEADCAGVAFSADPVSGRRGVAVVSAVRGLATALVSGETDADSFWVAASGEISSESLADKRVAHRAAAAGIEGTIAVPLSAVEAAGPALNRDQVLEVARLARRAEARFGTAQDIEWALDSEGVWLLQSRPITTLGGMPDPDGEWRLWDNSNIAESYGGMTTPLTYSFARRAYEEVYRQFCRMMQVPEDRIAAHAETFRCMIGLIRGRVYYNLTNWYRVLALLPGYSVNRPFMEQMMGVKESLDLPPDLLSKPASKWRDAMNLVRTGAGLWRNHRTLDRQIRAFYQRLEEALRDPSGGLDQMRPDQLTAHYRDLERRLLNQWDAPLVNDFFAMIFHGIVRKLCVRWCGSSGESLVNDLVRDSDIISVEPARKLKELADAARGDAELVAVLCEGSVPEVRTAAMTRAGFQQGLDEYIRRFGDRCLEELKLESPTLSDDPGPFFRAIGALARQKGDGGIRQEPHPGSAPETAGRFPEALKGRPFKQVLFRWVIRHARARVRSRENLRFERTRLFGRVRRIFLELGRRLRGLNVLDDPRDVFWLNVEEVLGFCDGTATSTDLRALAGVRRAEFDAFKRMAAPPDRFETRGVVNHGDAFQKGPSQSGSATENQNTGGTEERRGLGCCAGIVRGPVRVVLDPRAAEIRAGEILVAERTDPGWVMLFPAAAGILVERGSLLSHSAIVSRELGLPGIVSLPGLTEWLKTGDVVEMDGRTGIVRRITS